jgi:hypothetical protein
VVAWKGDELVRQWYPGRDNASMATDIAVDSGDELDGIDFALRRSAFLTVTVSAQDTGDPLPGAIVLLVSTTNSFARHFALRTGDRPGSMRVGPVTPGAYALNVLPGSTNPDYSALGGGMDLDTASAQVITLRPEDDVEVEVALPSTTGSPAEPVVTGWPGLATGFLAPAGDPESPW